MLDTFSELETEMEEEFEPLYHVIVHNDDITPFDFVFVILQKIFNRDSQQAEYITLTAHLNGSAYVVTLPEDEAKRSVGKAHFAASLEGFPLTFTIEPD